MDILFVAPILKYVFSFIHSYLLNFVTFIKDESMATKLF